MILSEQNPGRLKLCSNPWTFAVTVSCLVPYISFIAQKLANNAAEPRAALKPAGALSFIAQAEIPDNGFNATVEAKAKNKTG